MANNYPHKIEEVACEDAAEFFTGRSLQSMYVAYDGSGKIVLKFVGTDKYLVVPQGLELADSRNI